MYHWLVLLKYGPCGLGLSLGHYKKIIANLLAALFSVYKKLSINNKVLLIKKFLDLKMVKGMSIAQHINKFSTIINQLSLVAIEFDDEMHALILLAYLPNSWKVMRMIVSNYAGKTKLKFDDM